MLEQEERDTALSMNNALTELCSAQARFSDVTRRDLATAAADLSRYRFRTSEGANRSTREARRFFSGDLMRVAKKGFPVAVFLLGIFDRLPANTHLGKPGGEFRFTEIGIARSLLSFPPSVGHLRSDQARSVHV